MFYNYVWMFIILELIKTYQKTNSNDFGIQSYLFKANGQLAVIVKRFWVFY